jgi:polyhydroxybutyrate depolymerase
MKNKILFFAIFFATSTIQHLSAEESKAGWLRQKIRQGFVKKLEAMPAPTASKDVSTKIEKSGDYTFTFSHAGLDRYYKIHVPKGYSSKTAFPVLVVLHGGGGNMDIQADDEISRQITSSDEHGYIAVFPNGSSPFKSGQLATWNAGGCCGGARDKNVDDIGFFKAMIQHLETQLNVDKARIFADGMSNGGMMSYRVACEMSDTFKAIASVAGTDSTATCTPKNPISILHIHAQNDDHVLFNGGAGKNAFPDESRVTNFTSVPATVAKWVKLNGCEAKPKRVLEKKGAYCEKYNGCKNKTEVQLCVTEDGGHSWPGAERKARENKGPPPSKAISANDVIWEFFKSL